MFLLYFPPVSPLERFLGIKVHPIAYFEFLPGDKPGEKKREGPRGEAEEAAIDDAWRVGYSLFPAHSQTD